jgi:hypothetical protein
VQQQKLIQMESQVQATPVKFLLTERYDWVTLTTTPTDDLRQEFDIKVDTVTLEERKYDISNLQHCKAVNNINMLLSKLTKGMSTLLFTG